MNTAGEQRVLWGVAVPAAALAVGVMLVVTAWLVPETYPPDARLFLPVYVSDCRPEPLEQLRYVLAIALVPLVLWAAAVYIRRVPCFRGRPAPHRASQGVPGRESMMGSPTSSCFRGPASHGATDEPAEGRESMAPAAPGRSGPGRWPATVQWILCAFVLSAVVDQEILRPRVHRSLVLRRDGGSAGALLAVAWRFAPARWAAAFALVPDAPPTAARRAARLVWAAAPWLLATAACAAELAPNLLMKNRAIACHPAIAIHYPVFLEEFAAPAGGRTVLVNYFPQYQNLLGYALAPVFRVAGLNIFSFTAAMSLLSLALLLCFFAAFRLLTGGGWRALLLFLPLLWLSMTPIDCYRLGGFETRCNAFTYLAAAPLRYFGPAVTLAALAWYFARPSRLRMMAAFVTAGAAAVNNLDFGVPALGAALIAVLFGSEDGPLPRPRKALGVLAAWVAGTAVAAVVFAAGTYLRCGQLPDWGMATAYQRTFAVNGFAMRPMPPFGLHWAVYLTFMAVIAVGLFDRTAPPARRGLSLYAGVFGAGAMMYYVGRSEPAVLILVFPAWGFAFLLLAWSCWSRLAPRLRAEGWRALTPGAVLLALGYAAVAGRFGERPNPVEPYQRLTTSRWDADGLNMLLGNYGALLQCLRSHAAPGEKVVVIAPYGHLAAGEAGVVNVFPFSCPVSVLARSQLADVGRAVADPAVRQAFTDGAAPEIEQELARLGFRRTEAGNPFYWARQPDTQP